MKKTPEPDNEPVKDPFGYTLTHEGEKSEIVLPSLSNLPLRLVRKWRNLNETQFIFNVIEEYLSDDELDAFDNVLGGDDRAPFNTFLTAWKKHSGADVGES